MATCTVLEEADVAFDQQITELASWESQQKLSRSSSQGTAGPPTLHGVSRGWGQQGVGSLGGGGRLQPQTLGEQSPAQGSEHRLLS